LLDLVGKNPSSGSLRGGCHHHRLAGCHAVRVQSLASTQAKSIAMGGPMRIKLLEKGYPDRSANRGG